MTIIKDLKYEIAKSSEITKKSKQLNLAFPYKSVLNTLNTSQYKQCSCILTFLKYRPDLQNLQATRKKPQKQLKFGTELSIMSKPKIFSNMEIA